MIDHDFILIVDFGSQFTQLIARCLRESAVYCLIKPYNNMPHDICTNPHLKGVILSGSPSSVHDKNAPTIPEAILKATPALPILGICYGQQAMCHTLGGTVEPSHDNREFGRSVITILDTACPLVQGFDNEEVVWMSHGDKVVAPPSDFHAVAQSHGAPLAMVAHKEKPWFGIQFHPEVVHTPKGRLLLKNFTHNVVGLKGDWTVAPFEENIVKDVKEKVGEHHVLCGLSGGVDSSVLAVLLHKAIGARLTCILVDTGLLRLNEANNVMALFKKHYNMSIVCVDASAIFINTLSNVSDPEQKRKIIGKTFIDVFEQEAKKLPTMPFFLAQGTLYPDVIESVSGTGGPSATIKSHHNVGGLPERLPMALLEPFRELFKDEVRSIGRFLGLPDEFIDRHPFPGPGLAIRIPGDITQQKLDILKRADDIYISELRKHGLYKKIWQAFCVLLPVKTVGVMGDGRTYDYVCALRAVTSVDGMTADFFPMDYDILGHIATRIINEVKGINRVVYDITSKPPSTIEWE